MATENANIRQRKLIDHSLSQNGVRTGINLLGVHRLLLHSEMATQRKRDIKVGQTGI